MVNYKLKISSSVEKSLKKIPKKDLKKVVELIQTLAIQPYPIGCRKLSGEEYVYRVRQGNYRVIYEVQDKQLIVLVLKIGHRKDIYRK
ncbi:MAG: type II toxin-antitoxin system RelE/ParE family toxin [Halobacteriovoraceae bacterium]|nr:type II toxin-antitoxin system RelE/ParE family toxin [Halobacteriovoraceae bacterium]MCB9095444.1 type II toxin-antitoxin system RelE/ParE family toxin [Halobacteriovoraceae bacterium]